MNYIKMSGPNSFRYIRYQVPEGTPNNGYNHDNVYCCNLAEISLYGTESTDVAGDVNKDGSVSASDLVLLQKALIGLAELEQ